MELLTQQLVGRTSQPWSELKTPKHTVVPFSGRNCVKLTRTDTLSCTDTTQESTMHTNNSAHFLNEVLPSWFTPEIPHPSYR